MILMLSLCFEADLLRDDGFHRHRSEGTEESCVAGFIPAAVEPGVADVADVAGCGARHFHVCGGAGLHMTAVVAVQLVPPVFVAIRAHATVQQLCPGWRSSKVRLRRLSSSLG